MNNKPFAVIIRESYLLRDFDSEEQAQGWIDNFAFLTGGDARIVDMTAY